MSLLTLQCVRRFYETHFVQVFSSSSKINFSQYLVGYIHYFGALTVVVSKAENFTASGIYLNMDHRGLYFKLNFQTFSIVQQYQLWMFY
jgi:hypothetical protein